MSRQNCNLNDSVFTSKTQINFCDFFYKTSLLVTEKAKSLVNKTSNPTRVMTKLMQYLGIQSFHQNKLGLIWFMGRMLATRVLPQEVQTLVMKIVYNQNWRSKEVFDSKIERQCKEIVCTRLE